MSTNRTKGKALWIVGIALLGAASCRDRVERNVARILEWERDPTTSHVDRIRESLGDEGAPVRAGALAALVRLGTADAKERARAALGDPDGGVRSTAVKCLLDLRDAEAVADLARVAAGDPDWRARRGAVEAVGMLGAEEAATEILHALADPSSQVRLAAIEAVARLGPAIAVQALAKLATAEPAWENRVAASEALGRTAMSDAYAPLLAATADSNEFVRAAAAAALRELRRGGIPEPEEVPSAAGKTPAGQRSPKGPSPPRTERPAGGETP